MNEPPVKWLVVNETIDDEPLGAFTDLGNAEWYRDAWARVLPECTYAVREIQPG